MSRGGGRRSDRQRVVFGLHPVREVLRARHDVARIEVARGREPSPVLDDILTLAADAGVPVAEVDRSTLDRVADGAVHQGVVAAAGPFPYTDLATVLAAATTAGEPPLLVALDGVTDPHNLGSVARTAEAVGAHGLLIPSRRSAPVTPVAEKAAAGGLAHLPVVAVTNLVRALRELGEQRVWAVGLDGDGETDLFDCALLSEPVVLVVGAEGAGLSRLTREVCDQLVRLPMDGHVGSLNASVAAAVALYDVRRRRSGRS